MNDQQANALFEQSIALLQQGKAHEALKLLVKLDKAIPSNPGILFFMGTAHSISGNKRKAVQLYERVLRLNPQFIEAYNNLALDLAYLGEHRTAISYLDQALNIRPDFLEAIDNKGCFLNALGEHSLARTCFETALSINPNDTTALANLSVAFIQLGNYSEAQALSEKLIDIDPNDYKGYRNLGRLSQKLGDLQRGIEYFIQAQKLSPGNIDIYTDLGACHLELGNYEMARSHFENALSINPEDGASHLGLGMIHHDEREFNKAIEHFNAPLQDKYRLMLREYHRALSYLHFGDLARGWTDYALRWKESGLNVPYLQTIHPVWEGQRTNDSVLIWHEQGIGDQILFGTLIGAALERAANLTVRLDSRLISLFQRSLPNVKFVPDNHPITDNDFKYHAPLGDLPRLFRSSKEDFANQYNFLEANEKQAKSFQSLLGVEKTKIGLAWITQSRHSKERNLPIDEIVSVVNNSLSPEFIDLQYSDTSLDRERIKQTLGVYIHHLDDVDNFNDLDSLASLIEACDFVITCSNSTAHLAGALGKETYLLVPFGRGRHWYWSHIDEHGRSLWYPTVRIIPQIIQGDWSTPIEELKHSLINRHQLH